MGTKVSEESVLSIFRIIDGGCRFVSEAILPL
jgi:hypothetical protein